MANEDGGIAAALTKIDLGISDLRRVTKTIRASDAEMRQISYAVTKLQFILMNLGVLRYGEL